MSYFFAMDARRREGGATQFRGQMLVDAKIEVDDSSDSGNGGGPTPKIDTDVRKLGEILWIYDDGTPEWAIAAAESMGYTTEHVRDLPRNYPFE